MDKTGTLTEGKPCLVTVRAFAGWSEEDVLRLAASVECTSEHPLAHAIVEGAQERRVMPARVDEFRAVTGKGVGGMVEGRSVFLGRSDPGGRAGALRLDGQTVVAVSVDGTLAGVLGIADPIKPSTPEALRSLREEGIRVVMVTVGPQP